MRISDWSSDVCSSDLFVDAVVADHFHHRKARLARDHAFFPFAGDDDKCGHAILLAVSPPPCRPRAARSRDRPMGLTADQLRAGIDALAAGEPGFAAALARAGYPEPRLRDRGYATLLRTIVGQQVSVAPAASIWRKHEAQVGDLTRPATITPATA